jgi:endonuclease/exonuclease/phosphatase family metal-dependent hydrolase
LEFPTFPTLPTFPTRYFLRVKKALVLLLAACAGPPKTDSVSPVPGCRSMFGATPVSPVTWTPAPDTLDQALLDRWCAGVGPVVAEPAGVVVEAPLDSLLLVTWNTHVGGGDIPGLVTDLRAGRLTGGVPVRHFILLLQEVYRSGAEVPENPTAARPRRLVASPPSGDRIDIVETARRVGLSLYYVPSMSNRRDGATGAAEDRGNAILSTLPLEDLGAIELPFEGQRRVALAATVEGQTSAGDPWELRVVSVHLDNRSTGTRLLRSLGAGRKRQAEALVEALAAPEAIVVGGDLNTWSMGMLEGALPVLERHFPLPEDHPREPTFATAAGLGGMRLDRLMFRLPAGMSANARRVESMYGSDHHPLLGWITLTD